MISPSGPQRDSNRGKGRGVQVLERDPHSVSLLHLSLSLLLCETWLVLSFLWASVYLDTELDPLLVSLFSISLSVGVFPSVSDYL